MTTKWKTSGYGHLIEPVECVKETEKQVMLRLKSWTIGGAEDKFIERRFAKMSEHDCYFDTWDEAKAHLLQKAEAELVASRRELQRRQDEFGNVTGLKKPEGA